MFLLQNIMLSETFCGKNAEAAENGHIFQLLNVFERFVTYSRVERGSHQAVVIKAGVCCMRVCNVSIIRIFDCFGISVDLQNLLTIKDVP
jgi:hypothetical protein